MSLLLLSSSFAMAADFNLSESISSQSDAEFQLTLFSQDFGAYVSQAELAAFKAECKKEASIPMERFFSYEKPAGAQAGSFQAKPVFLRYLIRNGSGRPAMGYRVVLRCDVAFSSSDPDFNFRRISTIRRSGLKKDEWERVCGDDEAALMKTNYIVYSRIKHGRNLLVLGKRYCLVKAIEITNKN